MKKPEDFVWSFRLLVWSILKKSDYFVFFTKAL